MESSLPARQRRQECACRDHAVRGIVSGRGPSLAMGRMSEAKFPAGAFLRSRAGSDLATKAGQVASSADSLIAMLTFSA